MGNATNNKRFYWLKLEKNFFKDARIKKMRRLAGGDTYTIIYLKLMLLSLELDGKLVFEGIYPTFAEEMADKIDEYDNHLEDVKVTISWLINEQILLPVEDGDYQFKQLNVGSETKSNIYKKEKKLENFQSNSNQIPISSNFLPIEKEIRDRDKEKELDIENKNILFQILQYWNDKSAQHKALISHKGLNLKMSKAYEKIKKLYDYNLITLAIEHYDIVLADANYYFKKRWSLDEFLRQDNALPDFLDDGRKWNDYITSKQGKKQQDAFIVSQAIGDEWFDK